MTNRLVRPGASYAIPGTPYRPAVPAYDSVETRTGYTYTPGPVQGKWIKVSTPIYDSNGAITGYVQAPFYDANPIGTPSTATPYTYTVVTHHPAVAEDPGTPTTYVNNPPLGWTAFAHSINTIFGGEATWTMDRAVTGVVAGLTDTPFGTGGYSHITHGLLFTGTKVYSARSGSLLSTWAISDVFKVRSDATGITFLKNGASIGTEASALPAAPLYLAASIYGNEDTINAPSLTEMVSAAGAMTMPPMTMLGSNITAYAQGAMVMPAMTMSAASFDAMTMPAMQMFGSDDEHGAFGNMTMPAMVMDAYADLIPIELLPTGDMVLPAMVMGALSLTGQTATGAMTIPAMGMLGANYAYAQGAMTMPAMFMTSYPEDPAAAFMLDVVVVDIPMTAQRVQVLDVRERITVDVPMSAGRVQALDVRDRITVNVPMSAGGISTVDVRDAFLFGVDMSIPGADLEVHAVALDGYGSTAYLNYAFNSFARIGDRYYGAKANGVFELAGDTDAGADIEAAFSPGKLDFGSAQQKTIAELWLGVASDAPMHLTLDADGESYGYVTEDDSTTMKQQRVKLGKGMRANYLTPTLSNTDGGDFEIDTLELSVAVLSRKT